MSFQNSYIHSYFMLLVSLLFVAVINPYMLLFKFKICFKYYSSSNIKFRTTILEIQKNSLKNIVIVINCCWQLRQFCKTITTPEDRPSFSSQWSISTHYHISLFQCKFSHCFKASLLILHCFSFTSTCQQKVEKITKEGINKLWWLSRLKSSQRY